MATSWHETSSLFVLSFYSGWEGRKTYTDTETLNVPSTQCKNFMNWSTNL